jgi:hypothetical protein
MSNDPMQTRSKTQWRVCADDVAKFQKPEYILTNKPLDPLDQSKLPGVWLYAVAPPDYIAFLVCLLLWCLSRPTILFKTTSTFRICSLQRGRW